MIRSISLRNFKSIEDTAQVRLSPLTVITGPNSSGKSTLLQTLLTLTQTIQNPRTSSQLLLNGPLTRLGQFDDVLNSNGNASTFSIELEVCPTVDEEPTQSLHSKVLGKAEELTSVVIRWSFGDKPVGLAAAGGSADTTSSPILERFLVQVTAGVPDQIPNSFALAISRHRNRPQTRATMENYEGDLPVPLLRTLNWQLKLDTASRTEMLEFGDYTDVRGAAFNSLFPSYLTAKVNLAHAVALSNVRELCRRPGQSSPSGVYTVIPGFWKVVKPYIPAYDGPDPYEEEVSVTDLARWIWRQRPSIRARITMGLRQHAREIANEYASTRQPSYWLDPVEVPRHITQGINAARSEIWQARYIGPLRVQPSPIYPVTTITGAEDVGPSGEWTASVLDQNREAEVTYLPPGAAGDASASPVTRSLGEAVNEWLQYLEVAHSVHTLDRGSLGHELKVAPTRGARAVPLTHVGVGVSQCLPVIVALLLAPRGSITLLEQPELHLHPAVQSRLADFFLAMSLSGRQCLVETHSEYIVNRLRLRMAEDPGSLISDSVEIYFASRQGGPTHYDPVAVNEYGAIQNWPKGFFDQTQDDTEAILLAASRKRGEQKRAPRR